MAALTQLMIRARWLVIAVWVLLAAFGAYAAPRAVEALTYDFSLPGQRGYETNRAIVEQYGSGGDVAPLLLVVDARRDPQDDGPDPGPLDPAIGAGLAAAVQGAVPGARTASFADSPELRSADGRTGVVLVHYPPVPGPEPYAAALPALQAIAEASSPASSVPAGVTVEVTGQDALAADLGSGDGGDNDGAGGGTEGGGNVLAEVLFGAGGALVVLLLVFGSALAITPLVIAAGSILTTFAVVWGLTGLTDVSFIVQYLLSLIGLGVAIDYALLVVTRWREERSHGAGDVAAVRTAMATAGRSVLFSGLTVAVSLAALVVLPVPFLRSVGLTGLLIPIISVVATLTLLPALLLVLGPRLEWPRRRRPASTESRLWRGIGTLVVRRPLVAALGSSAVLLALAAPVLGLNLGQPQAASLASAGSAAAPGYQALRASGLGEGLLRPVEVLLEAPADRDAGVDAATGEPPAALADTVSEATGVDGIAAAVAPTAWQQGGTRVVDAWTTADPSSEQGAAAAAGARATAEAAGARVGGVPASDADFLSAVYGGALPVIAAIVLVTFVLLALALRSVWLPVKALVLNVVSIAAAYGMTVLIWQEGWGTQLLFDQQASGTITTWVPIAVFAFLFGLSMDYEVFLLARIREEHDNGLDTAAATVAGLARTGRLVTSGALILFLAFIALSRVPATDVKILATALALGILLDATVVRGILAPALVALLGRANWWWPLPQRAVPPPVASEPVPRPQAPSTA